METCYYYLTIVNFVQFWPKNWCGWFQWHGIFMYYPTWKI